MQNVLDVNFLVQSSMVKMQILKHSVDDLETSFNDLSIET